MNYDDNFENLCTKIVDEHYEELENLRALAKKEVFRKRIFEN